MTEQHRVLVVDDHELIRQGLARAFERAEDFVVVAQASSVAEAWTAYSSTSPEVVVTDLRLPDGTGLDLTRRLRESSPTVGVVVLTMYAGDEHLFAAMDAGASAFVAKDAPAGNVLRAARQAISSPHQFAATNLAEALLRRRSRTTPTLSAREMEVLELLSRGHGIAAIARRLFVSESTTKSHVAKIYEKLGAANRAQAIMNAVRAGLLADGNQGL